MMGLDEAIAALTDEAVPPDVRRMRAAACANCRFPTARARNIAGARGRPTTDLVAARLVMLIDRTRGIDVRAGPGRKARRTGDRQCRVPAVPRLGNPVNDARLMADTLRGARLYAGW